MAKHKKPAKLPNPALAEGIELKRRRSWLRRVMFLLLWTAGLVLIAAGVAIWVVTRSWFIISQVQPELERRLGGPVQIADAGYSGGGRFVFRGVVIRAPGHGGAAGRLGQIDRVELVLNPLKMIYGSESIKSIKLEGMHLRLSEDARNPGQFNFMSLHPDWSSTSPKDGPILPPRVEYPDLQVELGTDDNGQYTRIGTRRFNGAMRPDRDAREWYLFDLTEIDDKGEEIGDRGLTVHGRWNVTTNEQYFTIDGLALDDRTYSMCPQIVRDWWDRMELEGNVSNVEIGWKADEPLSIALHVSDVALTIPVETKDIWARYRGGVVEATPSRPRMHVSEGIITLEGDHLTLDNRGELGSTGFGDDVIGVPFSVRLDIPSLPTIDWENREQWFEEALNHAAFFMTFHMDGFTFEGQVGETAPAVDLPKVVAEALERFRMKDWSLTTEVVIQRGPPIIDENGVTTAREIESQGQAYIQHASCTYVDFPYPLTDVDAFLQFDSKTVKVQYLYGLGSEKTRIRLSGDITLPSDEAAVHLVLTAERVPIDAALRMALKPEQAKVFDALLHEPSRVGLANAGLLIDEQDVANAVASRESVIAEMMQLREQHPTPARAADNAVDKDVAAGAEDAVAINPAQLRMEQLRLELARLDRLILAGPFKAGGRVDLNLNIDREFGKNELVHITGSMSVREGGMIYELFPYPLSIIGGKFKWEKDRIRLVGDDQEGGITFVTPGGGSGRVTGEILFPRDSKATEPRLVIKVLDDRINDALLAAIPPARSNAMIGAASDPNPPPIDFVGPLMPDMNVWPGLRLSRASQLLKSSGLSGTLDYQGLIEPDETGRVNFEFLAKIIDGAASPGAAVSSPIGEAGLYWPAGFDVRDVTALLRVGRDAIELTDFRGRHNDGAAIAAGRMDLTQSPADITISAALSDLQVGDYLIDLAPSGGVARARALWERYRPSGSFDATLRYISNAETAGATELVLHPKQLEATLDGQHVRFARQTGQLRLGDDKVTFENLRLTLDADGAPQGELLLNGTYGMIEGDENIEFIGQWNDGELASPIVTEAMSLLGGEAEALHYRELEPAGAFDASFRYRSAQGSSPQEYELTMRPRTARFTVNDSPVQLLLDGGGEITIRPGAVTAVGLAGAFGAGRFNLSGSIHTKPEPMAIDLAIDYTGQLSSADVASLLPVTARETLEAIKFSDGPGSKIRDGRLALRQLQSESKSEWETEFTGVVETDNASFVGGVPFEQVNGTFNIAVKTSPDAAPEMTIVADARSLRAYESLMTDGAARITLQGENRIHVDDFRAEMYGGAVWGQARFGVEDNRDYEATISLAGVGLEGLLNKNLNDGATAGASKQSGDMFASVSVQGERGRADTQTGRGYVRIADGQIAQMPFLLGVLQLMEFMPPVSDALDFADIEFYIEGSEAVFNRIVFECPTLQLHGRGGMNLDTMDVNVLFRSRGTVMFLDDLIGGLNDQLWGISVTGPLRDPDTRIVLLPGLSEHQRTRELEWLDEQWRKMTIAPMNE